MICRLNKSTAAQAFHELGKVGLFVLDVTARICERLVQNFHVGQGVLHLVIIIALLGGIVAVFVRVAEHRRTIFSGLKFPPGKFAIIDETDGIGTDGAEPLKLGGAEMRLLMLNR